jgi:ABC-2 type transport system permease protein
VINIALRELRSLFTTPLAWLILATVQVLLARVFLLFVQGFLEIQGQQQGLPGALGLTQRVAMPLFEMTAFILMVVIPLVTMRALAEERRSGSLPLLLSAPVTSTSIILGKFFGAFAFVICLVVLSALMPISLSVGSSLDPGLLLSGTVALVMVAAAFTAMGIYFSTLTAQPTVAAVCTLVCLLFLWWAAAGEPLLAPISIRAHLELPLRGVLDSRDVAYFVLLTIAFLILSIRRLDAERTPP